jgi:uncharacterized pyridoxamine 5'-phosphate oxidase family protein
MSEAEDSLRRRVIDFIVANRAAALATVSSGRVPHVATVYCIVDEDLSIYFMTRVEGRKFNNLSYQPTVAMAFTNEKDLETLQLSGKAAYLDSAEREQAVWAELMRLRIGRPDNVTLPVIQLFERGDTNEIVVIKVTPYEMTFANFEKTSDDRLKPIFRKVL